MSLSFGMSYSGQTVKKCARGLDKPFEPETWPSAPRGPEPLRLLRQPSTVNAPSPVRTNIKLDGSGTA
jgi:hypothetical protein